MVEPIEPFKCGKLDGLERLSWPLSVDHFDLVKVVDSLSQSIVITVADNPD